MKLERKDREYLFGIELIPESEKETKLLKRFWDKGVNLNSYNGQNLTFSFGDLVENYKEEESVPIYETLSPCKVYLISIKGNRLIYVSNKCGVATLRETKMEKES